MKVPLTQMLEIRSVSEFFWMLECLNKVYLLNWLSLNKMNKSKILPNVKAPEQQILDLENRDVQPAHHPLVLQL